MSKIRVCGVTVDSTTKTYTYTGRELFRLISTSFDNVYEKCRRETNQMTTEEKEKIREEAYKDGYESGTGELLELKTLLQRILEMEGEE